MTNSDRPVVEVENLSIDYKTPAGPMHAVRDVTFSISRGEVLGLVGDLAAEIDRRDGVARPFRVKWQRRRWACSLQGEGLLSLPPAVLATRRESSSDSFRRIRPPHCPLI